MAQIADLEAKRIEGMLTERGINGVVSLMGELDGIPPDNLLATIKWWDDLPSGRKGTGLLVSKLREGGMPGYRRPHERTTVDGDLVVTEKALDNLRGVALTPDGCDRDTLRDMFAMLGKRANTPIDELIDSVVGADWVETPEHPAKMIYPAKDRLHGTVRYSEWVARLNDPEWADKPNPQLTRQAKESDLAWSMRFWGWRDHPQHDARVKKLEERIAKAKEAAKPYVPPAKPAQKSDQKSAQKPAQMDTLVGKPDPESAVQQQPQQQSEAVPAPDRPDLDEKFGEEAPWTDEDLDEMAATMAAEDAETPEPEKPEDLW